jgi:hypothetical protein
LHNRKDISTILTIYNLQHLNKFIKIKEKIRKEFEATRPKSKIIEAKVVCPLNLLKTQTYSQTLKGLCTFKLVNCDWCDFGSLFL